jgi:hypothetical protein
VSGTDAGRTAKLLQRLVDRQAARLTRLPDGSYALSGAGAGRRFTAAPTLAGALLAAGLVKPAEPGRLKASDAAAAYLARAGNSEQPFLAQHELLEGATILDEAGRSSVTVSRDESPIGALSRPGKTGRPWLTGDAVSAAERLRADFERGQLQPRITANWSASISTGRRGGDGKGTADLTDVALAARLRFERALEAIGPELAGTVVDVCCFLKGIETVERERSWPARSAKLVLRLGLAALARHYGTGVATGQASRSIRHWGAEGFRPEIS